MAKFNPKQKKDLFMDRHHETGMEEHPMDAKIAAALKGQNDVELIQVVRSVGLSPHNEPDVSQVHRRLTHLCESGKVVQTSNSSPLRYKLR